MDKWSDETRSFNVKALSEENAEKEADKRA